MSALTETLQGLLGHNFARPELLGQALTHASTADSRAQRANSNERLEFLGDRVLGLIVAEMVFTRFPNEDEGALAPRFTALARREALARVAREIGLGACIEMTGGEEQGGGRDNPGLLSDACEAVIAALYLDGGMKAAAGFVERYWTPMLEEDPTPPKDAKTALQEWAQGRGLDLPDYSVVGREGPAHAPTFTISVSVTGHAPVEASGASKRVAEQAAATGLLERLENGGKP